MGLRVPGCCGALGDSTCSIVASACSRTANASWVFFGNKQIDLAHCFCKTFKKRATPDCKKSAKV